MLKTVPGRQALPLSPFPFFNSVGLLQKLGSTVSKMREQAGGEPVFWATPGVPTIMVCDNEAARFLFSAPLALVDREAMRIGPVKVHNEPYAGGACPAAFSSGDEHIRNRAFTRALLGRHVESFQPAMERQTALLHARLLAGPADLVSVMTDWTTDLCFEWVLAADAPDAQKLLHWAKAVFQLNADTPVSRLLHRFMVPAVPSDAVDVYKELRDIVVRSPRYPEIVALGDAHGIPREQVPGLVLFTLVVNYAGGTSKAISPAVAAINTHPAVRERVIREIDDDAGYLAHVLTECQRLYTQPRYYYRSAQSDFGLPTGDGATYAVQKGDRLCVVAGYAFRDPRWFDDAETFDPERYERKPELTARVMGWGGLPGDKDNPFGCLGADSGFAQKLVLGGIRAFFRSHEFGFSTPPLLNLEQPNSLGPEGLQVVGFRPR